MEKIGFKVPEVAKNMSMQEAKLLDIADQLGRCEQLGFQGHSFTGRWDIISRQFYSRMLDHYHEVVGSVEGAELELLLEDLKATEVWKKNLIEESGVQFPTNKFRTKRLRCKYCRWHCSQVSSG